MKQLIEIAIVVLIVLKLVGIVHYSWWIILFPFWLGILIFLVGVIGTSFKRR